MRLCFDLHSALLHYDLLPESKHASFSLLQSVFSPLQGCNFFSASVVAHGGSTAFGFDNRLVTAGDLTNGVYPLWLVLQCPKATYLAKYTFNILAKKLTFSTTKYALVRLSVSHCSHRSV